MLKSSKTQQTAWPTARRSEASATPRPPPLAGRDSDESENEDKVPVPMFANSFGTAMDIAFENLGRTPPKG